MLADSDASPVMGKARKLGRPAVRVHQRADPLPHTNCPLMRRRKENRARGRAGVVGPRHRRLDAPARWDYAGGYPGALGSCFEIGVGITADEAIQQLIVGLLSLTDDGLPLFKSQGQRLRLWITRYKPGDVMRYR